MTDAERKKLEVIAYSVFHETKNANEGKVIGDIAMITGRSWRRSIAGLRMMHEQNLVPPGAINESTVGVWDAIASAKGDEPTVSGETNATRLHLVAELMDRLECVPRGAEFCFHRPKVITLVAMQKKYFSQDLEF